MNRKIYTIIIMILLVSLLIVGSQYLKVKEECYLKQNELDNLFLSFMIQSQKGFDSKYNEISTKEKTLRYTQATAGILGAYDLVTLTSYHEENTKLQLAIMLLMEYMNENSPILNKVNYDINGEIYGYLGNLVANITYEDRAENLINYLKELEHDK